MAFYILTINNITLTQKKYYVCEYYYYTIQLKKDIKILITFLDDWRQPSADCPTSVQGGPAYGVFSSPQALKI